MIPEPDSFDPARALLAAGSLGVVGGGLVGVALLTGWGITCPFLALTGWMCPFCGSTRMGVAVAQGDLAAAWGWNPVVLVGAFVVAVCSLWWLAELLGAPAWRPLARWGGFSQRRLYRLVAIVAVVFTVVRNLG